MNAEDRTSPSHRLIALITEAEEAKRDLQDLLDRARQKAGKLREACSGVGLSSSGSFVGYEADLYYGSFERPPIGEMFDPASWRVWGAPSKWQIRSFEDVAAVVESRSGARANEVGELAHKARLRAKELRDHALAILSPILSLDKSEASQKALAAIDMDSWGVSASDFAKMRLPSQMPIWDNRALAQGPKYPAHIQIEAGVDADGSAVLQAAEYAAEVVRVCHQAEQMLALRPRGNQSEPSAVAGLTTSRSSTWERWVVVGLLIVVAALLFVVLRPYLAHHMKSPFWSNVLASLVAGAILLLAAWFGRRLLKSSA